MLFDKQACPCASTSYSLQARAWTECGAISAPPVDRCGSLSASDAGCRCEELVDKELPGDVPRAVRVGDDEDLHARRVLAGQDQPQAAQSHILLGESFRQEAEADA